MIKLLFKSASRRRHRWWIEAALACRALLFVGNKFTCPCCEWRLRAFTHGGLSIRVRPNGYCPRCNSKARHRRDWLFLKEKTNLFSDRIRLLHVSPKYALARRLVKIPTIEFVGVDLDRRPFVEQQVDITQIPFADNSYDAILCIHVLEHIEDDRKAINELFRVLKPGGWALISVPLNLNQPTFEDPAIVDPQERKEFFGEEQHVRVYGNDFADRLRAAGFTVEPDFAADLSLTTRQKFGLLDDENVFLCQKI